MICGVSENEWLPSEVQALYLARRVYRVKNDRTPLYPGVELLNGVLINDHDPVLADEPAVVT